MPATDANPTLSRMIPGSAPVHFWTLRGLPDGWDPDRDPNRFVSGYSHSFLELFIRLEARGFPVSIGPRPPSRARAMVASLEELTDWNPRIGFRSAAKLALAASRCPVVLLLRGDLPLHIVAPAYVGTELMPNARSVRNPDRQRAMPLLPQRGMIRRANDRGELIDRLVLKSWRHNVPDYVLDPTFADRLKAIGVQLRVETEEDSPPRWHDFSDVDVALCVRRFHPQYDIDQEYIQKPPTKLVNAWCAGVIPLVAPEAAYLDLIADGHDALVVNGPEDILSALGRLKNDPAQARELFAGGQTKASDWSTDAVLGQWEVLLSSDLPRTHPATLMQATATYARLALLDRLRPST